MSNEKKERQAVDTLLRFIWVCVILIQMAVLVGLEMHGPQIETPREQKVWIMEEEFILALPARFLPPGWPP